MYKFNKINGFAKPFMNEDKGGAEGGETPAVTEDNKQDAQEVQPQEKTFTQSELDAIIEKRLARERKKFEDEIGKKKYEEGMSEAEKLSKMTATEKQIYEMQKKIDAYEAKEKELSLKALQSESKGILADKGYGAEDIKALAQLLDYTDAEKCKASIENLDKVIKGLVDSRVEAEVNNRLKTSSKPKVTATNGGGKITWEQVIQNPSLMAEYRKQNK